MPLLEVKDLKKSFSSTNGKIDPIISISSFILQENEQVAIHGASGSGKTTFLHLLAGVLSPDSGKISFDGDELNLLGESQRDQLRAGKIGYVFQSFNLLGGFTSLENIVLAMNLNGSNNLEHAKSLIYAVGLFDRINHFPNQLSIGQQQRVAIARALANRPKLVLADEPTGNLDPANTDRSLEILRSLCQEWGSSLILVSHDPRVIDQFDIRIDWEDFNQVEKEHQASACHH